MLRKNTSAARLAPKKRRCYVLAASGSARDSNTDVLIEKKKG